MIDSSNYCEREIQNYDVINSERYPRNHVNFSPILKPLHWIDGFHKLFGNHAFLMKNSILKEFDSVAPFDDVQGTKDELNQVRKLVSSYCEGIDNNPSLSIIGRFLLKKFSLNALNNRGKVLKFYNSNKKFIQSNGSIKAPVIITGFPRSGTTLLQRLMSEDPNTRSPYTYELGNPIPPMSIDINPMEDPRIKRTIAVMSTLSKLAPGFIEKFGESHYWSPTEMEESLIYMLAHHSISIMNNACAGRRFIDDFDTIEFIRPVLRYERLFFTMLDAYRPANTHWTLKAPVYAYFFPSIFEEYPDARVVLTHRNPIYVLPSLCRLMESWNIAFLKDGTFDKHRFGRFQQFTNEKTIQVPFDYRKKYPEKEGQIFDCMYDELFTDPIGMVKRIYEKFDLEYSKTFEDRMKVYLQNNKQGKYGRHKYTLEEYGFSGEGIYQRYKEYMDHFNYSIPTKIERPSSFDFSIH